MPLLARSLEIVQGRADDGWIERRCEAIGERGLPGRVWAVHTDRDALPSRRQSFDLANHLVESVHATGVSSSVPYDAAGAEYISSMRSL